MTTAPCVFCEIVAGRSPADIVASTAKSLIFRPLGPVNDGHVIVIPREHVQDAASPQAAAQTMLDASYYAATRHPSFNIITSRGRAATQSVFHLHIHVVPREEDDGLMVPWGTAWGENPQDPHWCRVAAEERQHADDLRRRLAALDIEHAQCRRFESADA